MKLRTQDEDAFGNLVVGYKTAYAHEHLYPSLSSSNDESSGADLAQHLQLSMQRPHRDEVQQLRHQHHHCAMNHNASEESETVTYCEYESINIQPECYARVEMEVRHLMPAGPLIQVGEHSATVSCQEDTMVPAAATLETVSRGTSQKSVESLDEEDTASSESTSAEVAGRLSENSTTPWLPGETSGQTQSTDNVFVKPSMLNSILAGAALSGQPVKFSVTGNADMALVETCATLDGQSDNADMALVEKCATPGGQSDNADMALVEKCVTPGGQSDNKVPVNSVTKADVYLPLILQESAKTSKLHSNRKHARQAVRPAVKADLLSAEAGMNSINQPVNSTMKANVKLPVEAVVTPVIYRHQQSAVNSTRKSSSQFRASVEDANYDKPAVQNPAEKQRVKPFAIKSDKSTVQHLPEMQIAKSFVEKSDKSAVQNAPEKQHVKPFAIKSDKSTLQHSSGKTRLNQTVKQTATLRDDQHASSLVEAKTVRAAGTQQSTQSSQGKVSAEHVAKPTAKQHLSQESADAAAAAAHQPVKLSANEAGRLKAMRHVKSTVKSTSTPIMNKPVKSGQKARPESTLGDPTKLEGAATGAKSWKPPGHETVKHSRSHFIKSPTKHPLELMLAPVPVWALDTSDDTASRGETTVAEVAEVRTTLLSSLCSDVMRPFRSSARAHLGRVFGTVSSDVRSYQLFIALTSHEVASMFGYHGPTVEKIARLTSCRVQLRRAVLSRRTNGSGTWARFAQVEIKGTRPRSVVVCDRLLREKFHCYEDRRVLKCDSRASMSTMSVSRDAPDDILLAFARQRRKTRPRSNLGTSGIRHPHQGPGRPAVMDDYEEDQYRLIAADYGPVATEA